jgi:hypothetical protein
MFDIKKLQEINLLDLSLLIENLESRRYFLLDPGQEHYKLLAHISTLYTNTILYDIGTYRGCSAIALSYNKQNHIKSFDIDNFRSIRSTPSNIEWFIGDFLLESFDSISKAPFIFLDIDHTGVTEQRILNFLKSNNWHGYLMLDDIYLNNEMRQFWASINEEKYDLTNIGHFSGTGLVLL